MQGTSHLKLPNARLKIFGLFAYHPANGLIIGDLNADERGRRGVGKNIEKRKDTACSVRNYALKSL